MIDLEQDIDTRYNCEGLAQLNLTDAPLSHSPQEHGEETPGGSEGVWISYIKLCKSVEILSAEAINYKPVRS